MDVFISWSGVRSRSVAEELRLWLPKVLPPVSPWVSAQDIPAGKIWLDRITSQLRDCDVGILCMTTENLQSVWMHYEAGALGKDLKTAVIVPYLIGVFPNKLGRPLDLLQAKVADPDGTKGLLAALNTALGTAALPPSDVDSDFVTHWPHLEAVIKQNSTPATSEHKFEPFPWIVSLRDATQWLGEIVNKIENTSTPQYADIVSSIVSVPWQAAQVSIVDASRTLLYHGNQTWIGKVGNWRGSGSVDMYVEIVKHAYGALAWEDELGAIRRQNIALYRQTKNGVWVIVELHNNAVL